MIVSHTLNNNQITARRCDDKGRRDVLAGWSLSTVSNYWIPCAISQLPGLGLKSERDTHTQDGQTPHIQE